MSDDHLQLHQLSRHSSTSSCQAKPYLLLTHFGTHIRMTAIFNPVLQAHSTTNIHDDCSKHVTPRQDTWRALKNQNCTKQHSTQACDLKSRPFTCLVLRRLGVWAYLGGWGLSKSCARPLIAMLAGPVTGRLTFLASMAAWPDSW